MNKYFKIIIIGLTVVALSFVFYKIYFMAVYLNSQKQADREAFENWYQKEFKPSEYRGILKYIDRKQNCFLTLTIYTDAGDRITYSLCSCNNDFVNFISKGDSILKIKDETFITFIKPSKDEATIDLPFHCK